MSRKLKPQPETADAAASLAAVVERAQSGDRAAFGELIEQTQTRLFRFCFSLCGDRALSEDLCQEAYLKAHDHLKKLENPRVFTDWLFQITKNLYLDVVRSKGSQNLNLDDEAMDALAGTTTSDFAEAIAVHRALSQFEAEDRLLILLVDLEERSYKEAAEILSISEDAVRTRLFRLRKAFLEKLTKD